MEAIRQLHKIGQLDDHFIPVGDEEIVKQKNLISDEYGESEIAELVFAFDRKPAEKLWFKKKINDQLYFREFVKQSEAYDLYEIAFHSDDGRLDAGDRKLALLTTLNLSEEAFSVEIRNHFKEATVELVKREVKLSGDELDKVDEFTRFIFRLAVAVFAMSNSSNDPQFDSHGCLFKFALIDQERSIDYDRMRRASVEANSESAGTYEIEQLVRTVYSDEHFKFVSSSTHMYPTDTYCKLRTKQITYNDLYSREHGIVIRDQEEQLIQAKRCYSSSDGRKEDGRKSRFVYLPKELCVISPISELLRKVTCLPRVILEIKRTIILKHARATWNHQILKINDQTFRAPIFRRIPSSNIVEYLSEHFKKEKQNQPIVPDANEASSNSTSSSDRDDGGANEGDEFEDNETLVKRVNELVDREFAPGQEDPKKKSNGLVQDSKKVQEISSKQNDFYPPMDPEALDRLQRDSMTLNLNKAGFSDLDGFMQACDFEKLFDRIVNSPVEPVDPQNDDGDALHVDQTTDQIPESHELKQVDFDFWKNESSDRQVICEQRLREALIMDSTEKNIDHERLEFLGDVFLKFVTCNLLFHLHPDEPVGTLDILKSNAVANKNLYMLSRRNEISQLMFSDELVPGLNWWPDGFAGHPDQLPIVRKNGEHLVTLIDSHGFRRSELKAVDLCQYQSLNPKRLSDCIESLIGKSLFDSNTQICVHSFNS